MADLLVLQPVLGVEGFILRRDVWRVADNRRIPLVKRAGESSGVFGGVDERLIGRSPIANRVVGVATGGLEARALVASDADNASTVSAKASSGAAGGVSVAGSVAIAIIDHETLADLRAGANLRGGDLVLEAASVIIQVFFFKRTGKRVFRMAPIHHHFELKGWAEPKVIVRFWIITVILVLVGLATLKLR